MNKSNKVFVCGLTLLAVELNDMVAKSNEIVLYINDHEDEWSQLDGSGGGDTLNYPLNSINSAGLSTPSSSDMAIVSNGNGWAWKKITNSSGSGSGTGTGINGAFKSRVFCRTNANIGNDTYIPTGGTYNNPWPGGTTPCTLNGITWYDGVPLGSESIWSSVCTFMGDGTNSGWSIPSRETDTVDLDIEFSLSSSTPSAPTGDPFSDKSSQGWYDPERHKNSVDWTAMIWRAERKVKNGSYEGNWVISRIKGEKGDQGEGAGTGSYVISSSNDNAVIDDQTTGESALSEATLNTLTILRGGNDVTLECTYLIQNISLPTGLNVKSVNNSTNKNSFVIYPTSSVPSTLTPSSSSEHPYYYDVVITHTVTENGQTTTNNVGTKRFKLYIDANVSVDGSFYKLSIKNKVIYYNNNGTRASLVDPIIKVYKISNSGGSTLVNITPIQNIASITPDSNKLYVELGTLYSAISTPGEQSSITLNGIINYNINGYDITLYKGSSLRDGPEHIICNGYNGTGDSSAYDLVIDPPYVIFEEEIGEKLVNLSTGVITYPPGAIVYYDLSNNKHGYTEWQATVQLFKDGTAQEISCSGLNNEFITATVTPSNNNTKLIVKISNIPSGENYQNITLGKISFWVLVNNSSLFLAIIPIYINRLGSRVLTIIGDTEETIMEKTIYDDGGDPITDGGTVIKYENIGKYLRSSQENISTISQKVDGIPTNASEILQRANQISLSVNSGFKNYIESPLAMTATKDSNCSSYSSSDLGDVVKITAPTTGNTGHSITFKIDSSFPNLKSGTWVTIYMLARCTSPGNIRFGWKDSTSSNAGLAMLTLTCDTAETEPRIWPNDNMGITTGTGTARLGTTGWFLCYRTLRPDKTLGDDSFRNYTVNTVTGTWLVHSVGVRMGDTPPTISDAVHFNGYKSAGIDITSGKIELKADQTVITDPTTTSKIEVTAGPDLVGKNIKNGISRVTYEFDTYSEANVSNTGTGGILTLKTYEDVGNQVSTTPFSTIRISPECITLNCGDHFAVMLNAYTGQLAFNSSGGQAIMQAENGNFCIPTMRHGYTGVPLWGLYYDDDGIVHILKNNINAPEIENPNGSDITDETDNSGEDTGNT